MQEELQKDYFKTHFDKEKEEKRQQFVKGIFSKFYTLDEWFYIWIREVIPNVVKENTLYMYGETMERHILPALGGTELRKITADVIQRWINMIGKVNVQGTVNGYMTEGTIRNTLSVLSGCMRDAQKYGLIEKNPCLGPAWVMPARNVHEKGRWLNKEQIARLSPLLWQYQNEDGYPMGIGLLTVLYTGLSMSEAVALRWRDVNFSESSITVNYFMAAAKTIGEENGEGYYMEKVTGRRHRKVPVPDFFCAELKKIQQEFQTKEDDFVVLSDEGEPVKLGRMRAALLRQGEKAGLGRVTPQLLRDTYAIHAVQAGASSDLIAELMGFSSSKQVIRRYMPKAIPDKRELVNRMYR